MNAEAPYRPAPEASEPSGVSTFPERAWAWLLVHRDGLALLSFLACIALFDSCAWAWDDPAGLGLFGCCCLLVGEVLAGFLIFAWYDEPEVQTGGAILMLAAFLNGLTLAVIGALT